MNLTLHVNLDFVGKVDELQDLTADFADFLVEKGYGNEDSDEADMKSYITVQQYQSIPIDGDVLLVVIPMIEDGENDGSNDTDSKD